jgi:hypothetical protein
MHARICTAFLPSLFAVVILVVGGVVVIIIIISSSVVLYSMHIFSQVTASLITD